MPSGSRSSRSQMLAINRASSSSNSKPAIRSTKSATAASPESASTGKRNSPEMPRPSRLVASTRTPGQRPSTSTTTFATASTKMLAVVEDQDGSTGIEHRGHPGQRVPDVGAGRLIQAKRSLHDRHDIALVTRDRQLGEPHAVGRVRLQPARDLERQPCLADAPRTGERHETSRADRVAEPVHHVLATDQRTHRVTEVAAPTKAGSDRRARPDRRAEHRDVVLSQYRDFESAELGAWFDPDLVDQDVAGPRERPQRLDLLARPVERPHQLRPPTFTERLRGDERLDVRDELPVPALREIGVDQVLLRSTPELVQSDAERPNPSGVGRIGQGRSPPQVERTAEVLGRSGGSDAGSGRIADQLLEPQRIDASGATSSW